jgi:hypothetical protein
MIFFLSSREGWTSSCVIAPSDWDRAPCTSYRRVSSVGPSRKKNVLLIEPTGTPQFRRQKHRGATQDRLGDDPPPFRQNLPIQSKHL